MIYWGQMLYLILPITRYRQPQTRIDIGVHWDCGGAYAVAITASVLGNDGSKCKTIL
jgi:hypothetical protein